MKKFFLRLARLILGLFLYSLSIVVTINANIGYAPYDVLHSGLSSILGLPIGTCSIIVGAAFLLFAFLFGEKIGLGSVLNMAMIGIFTDLLLAARIIPVQSNFWLGLAQLVVGLFITAFASMTYIGSGFGAGPRDSVMVLLRRKTKLPVGACRVLLEGLAVLLGALMGGKYGLGTLISGFCIGVCIQIVFTLCKFEPQKVQHETLPQTIRNLANKYIS